MSLQIVKSSVVISLTMLLGSGSALALNTIHQETNIEKQLISQSTPPEIIIDGNPQSRNPTTTNTDVRFTCQYINGQYTVMYNPQSQPNQSYPWATPGNLGGGWTSSKRCQEISQRLEMYRADGLQALSVGVENNYEIVCVTTQQDPSCRIVFTVPPGQDALLTRDLVFQNLIQADSGQVTQGINTFAQGKQEGQILDQLGQIFNPTVNNRNSSNYVSKAIDLRPFLDPIDGGTGSKLY